MQSLTFILCVIFMQLVSSAAAMAELEWKVSPTLNKYSDDYMGKITYGSLSVAGLNSTNSIALWAVSYKNYFQIRYSFQQDGVWQEDKVLFDSPDSIKKINSFYGQDGSYVVVWSACGTTGCVNFTSQFNGREWTGPIELGSGRGLVADEFSDGRVVAAWVLDGFGFGEKSKIGFREFTNGTWGNTEYPITDLSGPEPLSVHAGEDGATTVLWWSAGQIKSKQKAFGVWQTENRIYAHEDSSGSGSRAIKVSEMTPGRIIMLWNVLDRVVCQKRCYYHYALYYSLLDGSGWTDGSLIKGDVRSFDLASNQDGKLAAVWADNSGQDLSIFNGYFWKSETSTRQTNLNRMVLDSEGEFTSLFTDQAKSNLQYSQLANGKWSPPGLVDLQVGDTFFVRNALDKSILMVTSDSTSVHSASGAEKQYFLDVNVTGSGRAFIFAGSSECKKSCRWSFKAGATIKLNYEAYDGFKFSGWDGACTGTLGCSITISRDTSVTANFVEPTKYSLKIARDKNGIVSSEPAGIYCGGPNRQCSSMFSSAKLTATANPGHEFIRWNGCQAPESNICYIKPTGKMTVSAVFKKLPKYTVKITKNNLGSITSSAGGLNCPDKKKSCSVKFIKGTQVTLTAVPQTGRSFLGWSGACSGTDPCTLSIDGNKGVGATFQ